MTTFQFLGFRSFREEHRAHSPKCEFLSLNKKEEDWTVEDFLELETKRQINRMVNFVLNLACFSFYYCKLILHITRWFWSLF